MTSLPKSPGRTTIGFAFSLLNRAIKESLVIRSFGKAEMQQIIDFFEMAQPECVFCGNKDVARWDHLVPINKDGDTVLGNMVIACARCDDSKRDLDFEEWMFSDTRYSPKTLKIGNLKQRITRIKEYVDFYNYEPKTIVTRLSKEEQKRLDTLQSQIATLRIDLENFVSSHRERTGKK